MCIRDSALGGYDFLTDELVAVSPDGASMWGFIQPIRLRPGSGFLLPYLAHVATAEQVFDQLPDGVVPVSYTHLDVYKRQA